MTARDQTCQLCRAINNPFIDGHMRNCDTVLFKTPHFLILPSIGPIVIGHAMIVSRQHFPSLSSMHDDAIFDCDRLIERIQKLPPIHGKILIAEHGATANCEAGACVVHTHIHILPGLSRHLNLFSHRAEPICILKDLKRIHEIDQPYFLLGTHLEGYRVYSGKALPRQAFRRLLCSELNQEDWDWRTSARQGLIDETVQFWRKAFEQFAKAVSC